MKTHRSTVRVRATSALLILAGITAAGCSSDTGSEAGAGDTREVEVGGETVTVPADPQRVVVLNGGLAGYLYDLDVPVAAVDPRVLGVTNRSGEFPEVWAADAEDDGTVALPIGESVNVEFIAEQQPDLIIGGGQGFPGQQSIDAYDQLSAIAPTVLVPADITDWQGQLDVVAEVVGHEDQVQPMLDEYEARVSAVAGAIEAPEGEVVYLQSLKNDKPTVITPEAMLPTLMSELGFTADPDVMSKAGNPEIPESADWAQFSPELLPAVADAPVSIVIPFKGGRSLTELAEDPLYSELPSFESDQAHEFPATAYRPDYRGVMNTLDMVEERFS